MFLSKNSRRLIEYSLVIGGSFYLGMILYLFIFQERNISVASVKEFSPIIASATAQDLTLWSGDSKIVVKKDEVNKWLESYIRNYSGKEDVRVSQKIVDEYLSTIASRTDKEPVDARLKFSNNRAEVFVPSSPGRKLDIQKSYANISTALFNGNTAASLSFNFIEPEITLEKINQLGINDILGEGTSDYGKSPSSRINNIKVGMTKFNGMILKPGEEFSFNKILGEVEAKDGYQAELVIKNGQLVKEFGGGICQVSTTIFRAAINAGFPILERKPHSFPVQYYNPQGFDSTIYPGVVDLRFKNDTSGHVLIQAKVTGSRVAVQIYGSSDGREVKVTAPVQYDQLPSGAMKAYFTRNITLADGTTKEERFNSIYKAPPAHPLEKNPLE